MTTATTSPKSANSFPTEKKIKEEKKKKTTRKKKNRIENYRHEETAQRQTMEEDDQKKNGKKLHIDHVSPEQKGENVWCAECVYVKTKRNDKKTTNQNKI